MRSLNLLKKVQKISPKFIGQKLLTFTNSSKSQNLYFLSLFSTNRCTLSRLPKAYGRRTRNSGWSIAGVIVANFSQNSELDPKMDVSNKNALFGKNPLSWAWIIGFSCIQTKPKAFEYVNTKATSLL
jgi:hypothetical protein